MNKSDQSNSLSKLRQKIEDADMARETSKAKGQNKSRLPAEMMALVGRIATEMVAGVAVGCFLGWLLDHLLGTSPLMMIVFFFFGAGAGMLNIWRMASGHGLQVGYIDHQKGKGENQAPDDDKKKDRIGE